MNKDEKSKDPFEILAEWTIRKLKKIDFETASSEEIVRWVLYSLGLEKLAQDIYLYLKEKGSVTTTEVAEKFGISPTTARKYLEEIHTLGLADYIGRVYQLSRESLRQSIRRVLLPRIHEVITYIANIAGKVEIPKIRRYTDFTIPITDITESIMKSVEKSLSSLGIHFQKVTDILSSKIMEETEEIIKLSVFHKGHITREDLERTKEKNKKLRVDVFGILELEPDIDPILARETIHQINVFGKLIGPKEVLTAIIDRLKVFGRIVYSE